MPEIVDEPFFREWSDRKPGERRSLDRARAFAERLDLDLGTLRPLLVVGSKGKGTAATFAAATTHAAGLSVGLITSPGYRTHHERFRCDGASIPAADFVRLARKVSAAVDRLPPRSEHSGYLSPTGAFTIAGLRWLSDRGCDALVVEAGMGGASDESSLTEPPVIAVTEIFEEHVGIIGDDLAEIASDKAGAIRPSTLLAVSLPQEPLVRRIIDDQARHGCTEMTYLPPPSGDDHFTDLPSLPTELLRQSARLGAHAAQLYLGVLGHRPPARTTLEATFTCARLPGRLSVHRRGGQTWVVDSSINPTGVRAALDWCRSAIGEPTTLLLAIPDSKDLAACMDALSGAPTLVVRPHAPHLTFTNPGGTEPLPTLDEIHPAQLGATILALGTISFVGEVLDLLDVDMNRLF